MDNEQKPKRSWLSYALPYLFTTILVALIVWLIVKQNVHTSETWVESDIDTYVGYNANTGTWDLNNEQYYVSHVTYTDKENSVVSVSGRRYNVNRHHDAACLLCGNLPSEGQ